MNLKPITFRCTSHQWERLNNAISAGDTRTDLLTDALDEFLHYVEYGEGAGLDLFRLVAKIDTTGSAIPFGEQA